MRNNLYSNIGFYSSTFIKMHVKTEEDLGELQNVSLETEATFFHEYIHYLQDITTVYGLMNISAIVDYIKYCNQLIIDKNSFDLPIAPSKSNVNDVQANWELKKIYAGSGKGVNDIKEINSIYKCVVKLLTNDKEIFPERLVIDFKDSYEKNHQYSIGAYAIAESMAFTMEQYLYNDVLTKPNKLPYNSVEIVCDYLIPGFTKNPLNVIALCDAVLMTFNPGAFLFDTIHQIKKIGIPESPETIYKIAYSAKFEYNGCTTFEELLIQQSNQAITQLQDYFTTSIFKDNNQWIQDIFSKGRELRTTEPNFVLELMKNNRLLNEGRVENKKLNNIFHILGSPLIINDLFEVVFFPPTANSHYNIVPEYLWSINQIYSIYSKGLDSGTYKCEMISWCQKTAIEKKLEDWTDEKCRNAPWERSKEEKDFCTFSKVWKTWGLPNQFTDLE